MQQSVRFGSWRRISTLFKREYSFAKVRIICHISIIFILKTYTLSNDPVTPYQCLKIFLLKCPLRRYTTTTTPGGSLFKSNFEHRALRRRQRKPCAVAAQYFRYQHQSQSAVGMLCREQRCENLSGGFFRQSRSVIADSQHIVGKLYYDFSLPRAYAFGGVLYYIDYNSFYEHNPSAASLAAQLLFIYFLVHAPKLQSFWSVVKPCWLSAFYSIRICTISDTGVTWRRFWAILAEPWPPRPAEANTSTIQTRASCRRGL